MFYFLQEAIDCPLMEKHRVVSRAIVIDPIEDRIQRMRYQNHKASLDTISRQVSKHHFVNKQTEYIKQKEDKMRRSKSYVKQLFDNTATQNQNLVRKMTEIDDRPNNYRSNFTVLPNITNIHKKEQLQQIKKSNEKLVQKILHERQAKNRRQIIEQSCTYEKYKENLRKIKGDNNKKLVIVR